MYHNARLDHKCAPVTPAREIAAPYTASTNFA
jgi:hypothetical protein